MANATLTAGTFLMYKSGSPGTWGKLVDITEYPDLGSTIDAEDVTTLTDACHKYIDALPDPGGSVEFNGFYDENDYSTVAALAGTETEFAVVFGGSKSGDSYAPDTLTGDAGGALTLGSNTTFAVSFKGRIRVRMAGAGAAAARPVIYTITPTTGYTDHNGDLI